MAKDKSGYMAVDLGGPVNPVAANPNTLADAAAIRGKSKAASTEFWGNMALSAGQGYLTSSMKKELRDVAERTANPDTGYRGVRADEAVAASTEAPIVEERMAEVFANPKEATGLTEAGAKEITALQNELERINNARQQEILSPDRARAEMHAIVRKYSAALPGLSPEFRKQAAQYTGIDEPGLDKMNGLLNVPKSGGGKTPEQDAEEKLYTNVINGGYGREFGVTDPQQVIKELKNRTPTGMAMIDRLVTDNAIKTTKERGSAILESTKIDSEQKSFEYGQNLMAAVGASYADSFVKQKAILTKAGINLDALDITRVGPRESTAIMGAMREVYSATSRQISASISEVTNAVGAGKLTYADGQRLIDGLRKQSDDIEKSMNAPLDQVLEDVKALKTDQNLTLDNLFKTVQIRSNILTSAFGSKLVSEMQDDRKAEYLLTQEPNNQAYKDLREMIVSLRRDGIVNAQAAARFATHQNIAEGMFNPDATNTQKGAAADATPQQRADAAGLVKQEAVNALKQSFTPSERQARAIVGYAGELWSPGGEEYNYLKAAISNGRLKEAVETLSPNNPGAYDMVLNRIGSRAETLLRNNLWSAANTLKTGDLKLEVREGSIVAVKEKQGKFYPQGQASYDISRRISEWNTTLDMYGIAGGDKVARAKQLVEQINAESKKPRPSGYQPTYGDKNPAPKFSVNANDLKGLSMTQMEAKLKETGMPDAFISAILRDMTVGSK